jgi:hypothetical protein
MPAYYGFVETPKGLFNASAVRTIEDDFEGRITARPCRGSSVWVSVDVPESVKKSPIATSLVMHFAWTVAHLAGPGRSVFCPNFSGDTQGGGLHADFELITLNEDGG